MVLTIQKIIFEANNYFSLILEKPKGFSFYPGQYLDVELRCEDENGNTRAFTIASSPTENYLMITTKIGLSKFKQTLAKLQPGGVIKTSHQIGTFTLDETTPAVLIAGGIGITPFRSMIKYALDQKLITPITLLYSNSDNNFLFKKELDMWQKQLPNLTIHYIITSQSGRLDKGSFLKLFPKSYTLNSIYYLAGSPGMVDEFEKILLNLGVDQINIRYDRFDGY